MQQLTEIALEKAGAGVFTRREVAWGGASPNRQFGLLRRALKAEEAVRIHRGLYCLATKYLRQKVDPLVLAQRIYGPSYISLSHHGWIPEAVYAITSVSGDRSREFDTPLGTSVSREFPSGRSTPRCPAWRRRLAAASFWPRR